MPGPLTLGEIVQRLGGRVAGNADTRVQQVASLEHAEASHISFFTGKRHRAKLAATRAGALIVGPEAEGDTERPRIVADNPYLYFARVSQLFNPRVTQPPGVHASAVVAKSARLGARVSIGAGCVVGEGVEIGDDSCLYPRVVLYANCTLGRRVIVHSGAVIGADGFGIADDHGRWVKIPQVGGVRIGDDVEIGANTTIDRGALDDTVIEEGVKLDNQIQIGHNTRIGAHTAIAGCVGIAGSADIGRHCTFGGAAMILGHLKIVDHVNISAGTFISRSILRPGTYTGIWPVDQHDSWARSAAWLRRKGKRHE
ncbi:MAG TPA: UDP-3-O-(3-hydroxymyristoyl)glucosamine N-acyltransferase [Burkholderiales bacterium]|nr:UDP-3-O-(3-hydroxymyristoyl)glucosamine N-acyltransferase [Burkholderiales bacterium]